MFGVGLKFFIDFIKLSLVLKNRVILMIPFETLACAKHSARPQGERKGKRMSLFVGVLNFLIHL